MPNILSLDSSQSWPVRMADTVLRTYPAERWQWHYEHALVIKAIAAVGEILTEPHFYAIDQAWLDNFITDTGQIRTYALEEMNLDQVNPGKLLFAVYRRTRLERYGTAIQHLREQLRRQPRTPSGGFWHKKIYPNQMWLDGLYMSAPFLAEYAATFAEDEIFNDIANQFRLFDQNARDPESGLLYHAWDETRTQKWANPSTGCSPHFWGRAVGWYLMALVDTLDFIPSTSELRNEFTCHLLRLAESLVRCQDPETGMWYQVLDLPNRPENYLETSASAMFAYGLAKAVRCGCITADYLQAAQRAYQGLLDTKVRVASDGTLALDGICRVAGLGGTPYRDGTFEYYIKEPVGTNDFKGVGPFILAGLELEQMGRPA